MVSINNDALTEKSSPATNSRRRGTSYYMMAMEELGALADQRRTTAKRSSYNGGRK